MLPTANATVSNLNKSNIKSCKQQIESHLKESKHRQEITSHPPKTLELKQMSISPQTLNGFENAINSANNEILISHWLTLKRITPGATSND